MQGIIRGMNISGKSLARKEELSNRSAGTKRVNEIKEEVDTKSSIMGEGL